MMNILYSLVLYLCCVLCVCIYAMDQSWQICSVSILQEKFSHAKLYEDLLRTRLKQKMYQIKQRSYVVRALEFSTILLSWYVGEPYAAAVLAGGAAAIGAFTWQLAQAVEDEDSTKEQISNTQRYMSVLQALQSACDNEQLRQALQPRVTASSFSS